jgi:hypothetical protein
MLMFPLNPNRPVILAALSGTNPHVPVLRELRSLGYSLVDLDHSFRWFSTMTGLSLLCRLFSLDPEDTPTITASQPLWRERFERLAILSNQPSRTQVEELLRLALSSMLGDYIAEDERRKHYPDPTPPAVLPPELNRERLLADYCSLALCQSDPLPTSYNGILFSLRCFVEERCLRLAVRSAHTLQPPAFLAELELTA